jgi:8-amino-7-oxononanoate synthase
MIPFRYNTVFGLNKDSRGSTYSLLNCLDKVLETLTHRLYSNKVSKGEPNVFISVEGIYSMDGDVYPLADIVASVKKRLPRGNGYIISDETHSTGLLGNRGRGLVCKLELEREVVDRVHTFGKAMEFSGGTKIPINTAPY